MLITFHYFHMFGLLGAYLLCVNRSGHWGVWLILIATMIYKNAVRAEPCCAHLSNAPSLAGPSCSSEMGGHIKKVILFEIQGILKATQTYLFSHFLLHDSEV